MRVPTYEEPQVATRALPAVTVQPVRTQLDAFGQALVNAGAAAADIAIQEQNRRNVDAIMHTEAALKDEYLAFETSIRDRRGQNAWGATDEAEQWWERQAAAYRNKLENDAQRAAFDAVAIDLRARSLDAVSRHEAGERRAAVEEGARASILGSISLAASNATNPDARSAARTDVLHRVEIMSRTNGWTAERRDAETRQHLTTLHREVLENLVDVDAEAARQYFDAHAGDMDGAALDDIGKLVRTGGLRAQAQAAADEIMAAGLPEPEALARARRQHDGEIRDEVVSRLKTRYSERGAARQADEREATEEAWLQFARTGSVAALPTELLERLDGRTLLALRNEERNLRDGTSTATDWTVYHELREQAISNPRGFAAVNLPAHFPDLHPTERRQLMALQDAARSPETLRDAATLNQQIDSAARSLELKTEQRGMFESAVQQAVDREQATLSRNLTFDERQRVIDRMLIQGELQGGRFFGLGNRSMPLYRVAPEDLGRFEFDAEDIPAADRAAIEELLREAGQPVDPAAVVAIFRRAKGI